MADLSLLPVHSQAMPASPFLSSTPHPYPHPNETDILSYSYDLSLCTGVSTLD